MNCSVYIFGELSSGYSQYPEDSSSNILNKLVNNCKAKTQLVIRRDDNLMFYSYIRKLERQQYVGLCIVVNGYYIQQLERLFSLFEQTLERLVTQGSIICFSKDGNIVPTNKHLRNQEEDIDSITRGLVQNFNNCGQAYQLPAVDYTVSKNSVKEFNINDDKREIIRSSYTYGYTYIYKDADYNTVRLDSYRSVLSRVNKENIDLKKKNTELHEKNQEILRQKKQFRNVIFLILVVILCGIGIYFLYTNLNNTQGQLDNANGKIQQQSLTINQKDSEIEELNNTINSIEKDLNTVCSAYPFVVTHCEVSSNQFTFSYYSTEDKKITVTLIAINENSSEIVSNNHTLTILKGRGKKTLSFYYSLNTSDYYYVVLACNGQIIAGKRW